MHNLTKEWKQPPVVILQQANFYNIFIPCLWLRIISSWIFLHRYFLTTLIIICGCFRFKWLCLLIAVIKRWAEQCVLRLYRTSFKYFFLFHLQSWIKLKVRTKFLLNNFHTKIVIVEIAMMKIFNNCIAGRLNNNYFPLSENSSLC